MGLSLPTLLALATVLGLSSGLAILEDAKTVVIEDGEADLVVLDCPYALSDEDKDSLLVKWYFGRQGAPIYQWIVSHPPQAIGAFSEIINTSYEAVPGDEFHRYRALQLVQPSPDLGGQYECRVSSDADEKVHTTELIIWARPELNVTVASEGESIVMAASVENIYPEAEAVKLFWAPEGGSRKEFEEVETVKEWSDGFYHGHYRASLDQAYVKGYPTAEFGVEVTIRGVDKAFSQSVEYNTRIEEEDVTRLEATSGTDASGTASLLTLLTVVMAATRWS